MEVAILYVKSKKIILGQGSGFSEHHGYVSSSSESNEEFENYPPDDQEVISLLNQAEIAYKLIDIAKLPFTMKLKTKMSGIRTPTLVLNDKKIVGLEEIKRALEEIKT